MSCPPRLGTVVTLAALAVWAPLGCGEEAAGGQARAAPASGVDGAPPAGGERTAPAGAGAGDGAEARADHPARAQEGAAVRTVGTFRAVVDGEERTWYAVEGEAGDGLRSSAVWVPLPSPGQRLASLSGFDRRDVPVADFDLDLSRGEASLGDYGGSLLFVAFPFGEDDFEIRARVPGSAGASVMYVPEVAGGELDFGSAYMLSSGTVDVVLIDVPEGGPARFEGTFSGTLRTMDGASTLEVTGGRFTVERARRREPRSPGGRPGGGA